MDTPILFGCFVDHEDGSTALFLEADRRLGQHITLEFEGRIFARIDLRGDLAAVARDDAQTLRASWNF